MSVEFLEKLRLSFSEDSVLERRTRPGNCRLWTDKVLDLVEQLKEQGLTAEAREVKIEPGLYHTFVRLNYGEESYLWDGIGAGGYKPYFGPEDQAPDHLRNSNLDMISRIRDTQNSS
ncbi:MAG: hypothetical protein QXY90_05960 [Candidatus Anstonellales archaeon]